MKTNSRKICGTLILGLLASAIVAPNFLHAQVTSTVPNDLPNTYKAAANWAKLPDGRTWGATGAVYVAPDGNIWVFDRCGSDTCEKSTVAPVSELTTAGNFLKSFGAGEFLFPHGLYVDKEQNIWLTDSRAANGKGLQVFKFSPDGKKLLTLGKAGVSGDTEDTFGSPTAIVVAANGDIFVADGHNACGCPNSRVVKFSAVGKFIKVIGKKGSGPGELDDPHSLAFDSQGRLFVADRSNNRIQIFDQEGTSLATWKQFGRPSGIFIDKNDTLYVTDSESTDAAGYGNNPGVKRGIRIGSARTGLVSQFIPSPDQTGNTSGAEGIAVDHEGNLYGAEVKKKNVEKYLKQ
jgi:sugar lactone lactonase YvrE